MHELELLNWDSTLETLKCDTLSVDGRDYVLTKAGKSIRRSRNAVRGWREVDANGKRGPLCWAGPDSDGDIRLEER